MGAERFIEMTGDSIEDAIAKGLNELGVGPNDVIVEVLDEPSRGMFGIGARPARVRLQLIIAPKPSVPVIQHEEEVYPSREAVADYDASDDEVVDEATYAEDAEVAKVVLTEILEKMSIRASIRVRRAEKGESDEDTPWLLDVTGGGDDLSSLIGRRGETLAALQYITRLITSRELQRRANIVVDVDGYKARRTSKLFELADRMAEQAVRQQRTISLEPMPPYERRIIHLALRERTDVTTNSVGEGDSRKVTIVPT